MAYFAVFKVETGEVENIVECPEFLKDTIFLNENERCIQIESQVLASKYLIVNNELVLKS